jgi:penicillin-binding protein 1B
MALAVPVTAVLLAIGYYSVTFGRLIDARPRRARSHRFRVVLPVRRAVGQSLTDRQLVDRLNDLGYAQRPKVVKPGEFDMASGTVSIIPRGTEFGGQVVRVVFQRLPPPGARPPARRTTTVPRPADRVLDLNLGGKAVDRLELDAPVLTALVSGEREKRRAVAMSAIPAHMTQAVLAIEDRRFYEHPGVDPIGIGGAFFSYVTGRRARMAGGSTITQQLIRNVFLPKFEGMTLETARARSFRRKALEVFLSVILTIRASKDEILEMYLNDVPLGQRGSFSVFGVAEGARLFFGKDVSNISVAEAATIAGVIQAPAALSPFNNPARSKERRNVVLAAMSDAGFINEDAADRASREPLAVSQRALEAEACCIFVDFVDCAMDQRAPLA